MLLDAFYASIVFVFVEVFAVFRNVFDNLLFWQSSLLTVILSYFQIESVKKGRDNSPQEVYQPC